MGLSLSNVDVVYGGVIQVLRSTNLEVPDGQMVVLLGSNGAGKTTTLRAISGLLHADLGEVTAGRILFDGEDITNGDPATIFRKGIVQVLEGRKVLEHLTVEQNLMVGAHARSDHRAVKTDLERIFGYFPRLPALLRRTAGYLSGGEMQMLLIGRALMARPKLLILDEPSMGLAPILVEQLFEIIGRIKREEGLTVLLVEQNARAAIAQCDYGYVMDGGRIVLHGSREQLENNQDVQEFYLGFSGAEERTSFRDIKHYRRRKRWLG
ncbi:ABC transporter ATP-binding protein [Polymorphum gilvum]|uniref:ABC-type branched-chain amino acid transport systems, ATPase component n=1 Tax=Polymorphum gilvum (strain LMG 25793 / CGMCC 1.9160 / SL003B-26A1) TaxID=991905 RepID=F2IYQ6_POLGS|nr:ABC transporter ATP-binding protein [Polymorphum gilvum]ADZ69503.1 ABC-type branched-chain amino acid transport systems, ATPase component [Polymorphum gilvum SL003B-26A1]